MAAYTKQQVKKQKQAAAIKEWGALLRDSAILAAGLIAGGWLMLECWAVLGGWF